MSFGVSYIHCTQIQRDVYNHYHHVIVKDFLERKLILDSVLVCRFFRDRFSFLRQTSDEIGVSSLRLTYKQTLYLLTYVLIHTYILSLPTILHDYRSHSL